MLDRNRKRRIGRLAAICAIVSLTSCASDPPPLPPAEPGTPKRYIAPRAAEVRIDGRLDDHEWAAAAWSDEFVDIEGARKPTPRHRTRMKMMWDDENLYIAAWMDEPHVWATYDKRDMIVFHENDFEIFIDPDGDTRNYYEVEVNALSTIFDLFLPRTYIDGGPADHDWNCPGMKWAVHIDGTVNDPRDVDRGWSVEVALPWGAFEAKGGMPCPPRVGDAWRINFSRVQWQHEIVDGAYRKVPETKENNWVWTPQGVIDMHRPQRWGYVEFK